MTANNRQIGGEHYRSAMQHWDLVYAADLNYYEGNATKYLARHRKKNGRQDLEKAIHYIDKLIEIEEQRGTIERCVYRFQRRIRRWLYWNEVERFVVENGLDYVEAQAIRRVFNWHTAADLQRAATFIEQDLTKHYVKRQKSQV